jgi:predicted peptidase
MEELALATLTAASKEFKGDPKRTYLTGLSRGGDGSWALAAQHLDALQVTPLRRAQRS